MKKLAVLILAMLLPFFLSAASVRGNALEDSFESLDNLALFDFTGEEDLNNSFLDEVQISLVTTAPGSALYSWFGHTGLMIETPTQKLMYDWGVFSFSPSFFVDFVMGRLYYQLLPGYADAVLSRSIGENRTVEVQTLPLSNAAKSGTIDFVNYNSRSENRTYLYHYYLDNCATRVRDIINEATGGDFRAWAEAIPTGHTFRDYSSACLNHNWLASFTINYLQGPSIDEKISLYDACFLPSVLNSAVKDYFSLDDNIIYQGDDGDFNTTPLIIPTLIISLILTVILYTASIKARRLYGILSFILWFYLSALSCILVFVVCFTNHDVAYNNENLIFINPLLLIPMIQSLICIFRGKKGSLRATTLVCRILLVLTLASLVLKGLFPEVFIQDNFAFHAFVLPLYLAFSLRRKGNV